MIKIFFLFFLFMSSAWARVNLELKVISPKVKQGQIVDGKLIVREANGTTALSGLKNKNLGKSLYIYGLSPFMGKQGQLEADAKVIFVLPPQSNSVSEVINGEEIVVSWINMEVIPTEAAKSFLFGDFEIPERIVWGPWILGIIGLGLLSLAGFWIKRLFKNKSEVKSKKLKLKNEITSCASYDDIVLMWRQKKRYLDEFPVLETEFKSLEEVLFKYQFKPQRSEQEIEQVTAAYQKFRSQVLGALNGI